LSLFFFSSQNARNPPPKASVDAEIIVRYTRKHQSKSAQASHITVEVEDYAGRPLFVDSARARSICAERRRRRLRAARLPTPVTTDIRTVERIARLQHANCLHTRRRQSHVAHIGCSRVE